MSSARASLDVDGVEVDVVASDGSPVADVDVLYVDSAATDAWRASGTIPSSVRFEDVAERSGLRFRTNGSGTTSVPQSRDGAFVGVAHAGSWAEARIEADTDRVTLRLEPDFALDVRVRGANAADLAVIVLTRNEEGAQERTRGRTDAQGRVRFERLGPVARMARRHSMPVVVAVEVLSSTPVLAEFASDAWPERPLELVLPETGEVHVEFFHPERALSEPEIALLARGDSACTLSYSRDELGRQVERRRQEPQGSLVSTFKGWGRETPAITGSTRALEGARATFGAVGLGLELAVRSSLAGWSTNETTFRGPSRAGERVIVRIPLVGERPQLSGRLVDASGRPFARREFVATFTMHSQLGHTAMERGTTDVDGRFRGLGNVPWASGGHFDVTIALRDDRSGAAWRQVFELGPHTADLGDVVIEEPRLLASGRVVDDTGAPVRGALVTCEAVDSFHSTAMWTSWRVLPNGSTRTDADGRFEIRSWTEDSTLRIGAARRGHLTVAAQSFAPPRSGLELVLVRGGTVEGRLLARSFEPRQRVQGLFQREGDTVTGALRWLDESSFRCEGLAEGSYELRLGLSHQLLGMHVIRGISVRTGATTKLAPIDVDAHLRVVRFDVRDPEGRVLEGVRFAVKAPWRAEMDDLRLERGAGGCHELRTFERELSLVRVSAPGHASISLEKVDGDHEVVLRPGPRVKLVLANGVPPITSPWSLVAIAQCDGAEPARAVFDASGVARAQLERPGAWRIGLGVSHSAEPGERGTDGIGWTIEVREGSDEQVFESPPITEPFLEDLRRVMR